MIEKDTCQCITEPCNCPQKTNIQPIRKPLSNTQKWAIVIGGTLVLYYLIYKVSEGK